jgi:hypothetical protein
MWEPKLEQTHGMLLSPFGNLSHTSILYYNNIMLRHDI